MRELSSQYQEALISRAIREHIPLGALLELTQACNLRCTHCYLAHETDDEMSSDEVFRALDELAALGVFRLVISGGEILMRKDFFDVLAYARRLTFCVNLITNGTLLTPEIADRLVSHHPWQVAISIYSADPSLHDVMTGLEGSFDRSVRAIRLLKERGIDTRINSVVTRENARERRFERVKELADSLGVELVMDGTVTPHRESRSGMSPCMAETCDLAQVVSSPLIASGSGTLWLADGSKVGRERRSEAILCPAGFVGLSISPHGDVFPCSAFPLKVGNVREESLRDIWRDSPALAELRRWRRGDIAECRECEITEHCRYCPGLSLTETGRVLAPPASACLLAGVRANLARATALGSP